jgi:hypothetical protein
MSKMQYIRGPILCKGATRRQDSQRSSTEEYRHSIRGEISCFTRKMLWSDANCQARTQVLFLFLKGHVHCVQRVFAHRRAPVMCSRHNDFGTPRVEYSEERESGRKYTASNRLIDGRMLPYNTRIAAKLAPVVHRDQASEN